jgi:hypothetical protein
VLWQATERRGLFLFWRCDTTASNLFIERTLADSGGIFPGAATSRLHLAHTSPCQVCFLCQLFANDDHDSSNCPGAARYSLQPCLIVAHEERDRLFDIDISGQSSDDFAVLLPPVVQGRATVRCAVEANCTNRDQKPNMLEIWTMPDKCRRAPNHHPMTEVIHNPDEQLQINR